MMNYMLNGKTANVLSTLGLIKQCFPEPKSLGGMSESWIRSV